MLQTGLGLLLGVLIVLALVYLYFLSRKNWRLASIEQARLAAIVESSNDAIIGKRLDGVVTDWNPAAAHLFGYTAEEAIGRTIVELIVPPNYRAEEEDILKRIGRGEMIPHFQTRRRRKDGSIFDVAVAVSPIRAQNGEIIGAAKTLRDISAQKAAEAEIASLNANLERQVLERTAQLEQLSDLQKAILADTSNTIIATDIEGKITLFNPAAERLLGYRADQLVGKLTPEVFHDPAEVATTASQLSAEFGSLVKPGFEVFIYQANRIGRHTEQWTYIRSDGTQVPVLLTINALKAQDGTIRGYLGVATDLTERQRHEQAIRDSEVFLRTLTDNIPAKIAYFDSAHICRFVNKKYEGVSGQSIEEILGARKTEIMTHVTAALGGERRQFEDSVVSTDNRISYFWVDFIPDIADDGVRGFYAVSSNITELHNAQDHLETLNETLKLRTSEAESATVAKGQFLANMSHEIRSPMNAILGMLLLLQRTELSAGQRHYTSNAYAATQSLLALINDILDFSKVEAGKIEIEDLPFSIDRLLRDTSAILSESVGSKDVELLFSIDRNLPGMLKGDAFRLRQVLINLAGNAVKFTEVGDVVVSLQVTREDSKTVDVEFSVADTGIGIAKDRISHVFEGFSQAESSMARRYGGSGLGLAISQKLVSLMGGRLRVESEPGIGSRFYFTLTLEKASADEVDQDISMTKARSSIIEDSLNVLIVDDHQIARDAVLSMAESLGWHGDCASSASDALALLTKAGGKFYDIIFLDWKMPDIDGFSFAREVRQKQLGEKISIIIMVTAHAQDAVARRTDAEPDLLDGFLVKPITASMLLDAVISSDIEKQTTISTTPHRHGGRLVNVRLLVVEDSPINQQIARELLTAEGAIVEVADDGDAGVNKVLAADPPFDAVLMDIQMPNLNGYDASRKIRQHAGMESLPIIAMTANVMPNEIAACLEAGMNDHVAKPIDLDILVDTIQTHVYAEKTVAIAMETTEEAEEASGEPIIDFGLAMQRLGNDEALYIRIVQRFIQESGMIATAVGRYFLEGRRADALRALHSLKGLAGTIGAKSLAKKAAALEVQLSQPVELSKFALKVAELADHTSVCNRRLSEFVLKELPAPNID